MENMNIIDRIANCINYCISYNYGKFVHTPKYKISAELAEKIRKHGLVHFGKAQHMESILTNGMLAEKSKPLCPQEAGMSWFYLNETDNLSDFWDKVKEKGERKNNDTAYFFEEITDEQIAHMLVRPSDGAIVFIGDFATPKMYAKSIDEILNQR